MKTKHDDGLEWLRSLRRQMAAECQHDPKKLGQRYRQMQRQFKDRLYRPEAPLSAAK